MALHDSATRPTRVQTHRHELHGLIRESMHYAQQIIRSACGMHGNCLWYAHGRSRADRGEHASRIQLESGLEQAASRGASAGRGGEEERRRYLSSHAVPKSMACSVPSVCNVRSTSADFSSMIVKKNAASLLLASCGQHTTHAQSECWPPNETLNLCHEGCISRQYHALSHLRRSGRNLPKGSGAMCTNVCSEAFSGHF